MTRVILQWPSFGPYHTARLAACAAAAPEGTEVVGLAVAGQVEGRPWVADAVMDGVRIETLFPRDMYHQLDKRAVAKAMWNKLEELQPVAVGTSGYGMADSRAALRWCRSHRVTRVLMTESKADDAPRKWWKEWIKRRLVAGFDSALCGGSPHRAYLEELGMPAGRIFDRYDVVDNDRFARAADEARRTSGNRDALPGLNDPRSFFLASSRFIPRKNLATLIEAFAEYRRRHPDGWRLVILGTGPDEADLRKQVETHAAPDVTFAGFHQFETLAAYYAFAGAFVHPALQEQWGLVVNEAMACGLPVIASRTVGAAHDLVKDGENGFRFDPSDAGALSAALAKVADDPQARDAMAARSREIIAAWTPENFANNFWKAVRVGGGKSAGAAA